LEYHKEYNKQHYLENKQKYSERNKKNYEENKEKIKIRHRKHYNSNKKMYLAKDNKRRAAKLNATLDGYDTEIKEIYKNCPDGYHVDHIYPLINDNVCGLHVPWNLQYLPEDDNLKKSNSFDGTIENEGWIDETKKD